ncbi:HD domain-containing protein [Foetidibacter luteolus]|uniref:HD domain-containing protein n=1 Tax=Foetidibacter luteolus TaxID=2608880 RepID=UPI00129C0062|nr:HD domain-containing protein [Foetidibacter luteolus]
MAAIINPQTVTAEIKELFEKHGSEDYDGEPVTQTSHMLQCAMQAMSEGSDIELILGALLHDVGHLLRHKQHTETMGNYGVVNHEGVGAAWLAGKGFSGRICAMVEMHVPAKRYLVTTNPAYRHKLSEASLQTMMQWQGGLMSPQEVQTFQQHPFFEDIIKVRRWDEEAKKQDAVLLPLQHFTGLILDYLKNKY